MGLREDIESAINRNSAENGCDTPDFILAEFLTDCLAAFDKSVKAREKWYGRERTLIGGIITGSPIEVPEIPKSPLGIEKRNYIDLPKGYVDPPKGFSIMDSDDYITVPNRDMVYYGGKWNTVHISFPVKPVKTWMADPEFHVAIPKELWYVEHRKLYSSNAPSSTVRLDDPVKVAKKPVAPPEGFRIMGHKDYITVPDKDLVYIDGEWCSNIIKASVKEWKLKSPGTLVAVPKEVFKEFHRTRDLF